MKKLFIATALILLSYPFLYAGIPASSEGDKKSDIDSTKKTTALNAAIWHRKDGTVSVNFEKKPNEVVFIKLYDDRENLLLQEAFRKDNLVSYRYDLSKLPQGAYYIEVTNKRDVLRKEISVK
jgi:hypothetical protein